MKKQTKFFAYAAFLFSSMGCERPVHMDLNLLEPCNQANQALTTMASFEINVDGLGETDKIKFTRANSSAEVSIEGTGTATVTVKAWVDDADVSGPTVYTKTPNAIGRTLPVLVDDGQLADFELSPMVGRLNEFAQSTKSDGKCNYLKNGGGKAGRYGHTATYLPAIQRVLIVGGVAQEGSTNASIMRNVDLFDPVTGKFSKLDDLRTSRAFHTATALSDGRVLIAGGFGVVDGASQPLLSAVLLTLKETNERNAETNRTERKFQGTFEVTQAMAHARAYHTATLFEEEGLVAMIGGCGLSQGCKLEGGVLDEGAGDPTIFAESVEVFRVDDESFGVAAEGLEGTRAMHRTTRFSSSQVLVTGGLNADGPVCSVEVLKAVGGTVERQVAPGARVFSTCPFGHAQVSLGTDDQDRKRIAIIGGFSDTSSGFPAGDPSKLIQYWNTGEGIEGNAHELQNGRAFHGASALADGSIVVVGGELELQAPVGEMLRQSDETPGAFVASNIATVPDSARAWSSFTALPNNQVVLLGGLIGDTSSDEVFVFLGE